MPRSRGWPTMIASAVVTMVLVGLAGCAEVPTSGPVDPVPGHKPTEGGLKVDPAAPRPGDDPKTIVEGFLQAMASYEPTYATARQYLTADAAERWDPNLGTSIYVGELRATTPTSIVLDAKFVGVLGEDRIFSVRDQQRRPSFGVQKENGEWRINTPPRGLLVPKSTFDTFYERYNVYFIGRDGTLVPDSIYLPEQANIASALILALLDGPSTWLGPVVTTALPSNTRLNVQSVTVSGGVAKVQLNDVINDLNDEQRTQMAAQIAYTLRQDQVTAVKFQVDGEIYRVPGANPSDGLLPVNSVQINEVASIPPRASEQLYAATKDGVRMIKDPGGRGEKPPVPGEFGDRGGIRWAAASLNDRDLAVVTNDRTVLRRQPEGGEPSVVIKDATDLLRPQYSRQGELWEIGEKDGKQRIWVLSGDKLIEAQAPVLGDAEIVSFRLSPDGSRIALIRESGSNREIGLARVNRLEGRIIVDGWRRLDTAANQGATITQFRDVAWRDDSRLMVIGAAGLKTPVGVFEVSQDASEISTVGELTDSDAVEITASPRHNQVAMLTRSGYAYRLDPARRWARISEDLESLTYPG